MKQLFSINIPQGKRLANIEIARGIAMLLVIINHCNIPYAWTIMSFHMPLFFILSGYLRYEIGEKYSNVRITEYIKKRFLRIMVPYYAAEVFCLAIWFVKSFISHAKIDIVNPLINIILVFNNAKYRGIVGRLWFLPCIFLADILLFILTKYFNKICCVISAVVLLVIEIMINAYEIVLPFCLGQAVLATFFMLCGYLCGKLIVKLFENKALLYDFCILAVAVLILVYSCYKGTHVSMDANKYGNWVKVIAGAVSGSTLVLLVSKYLVQIKENNICIRYIKYISFYSLQVYILHLIISFVLKQTAIGNYGFVVLTILLIAIVPAINITNKLFPSLFGVSHYA